MVWRSGGGAQAPIETDPAIVTDLIGRNQESIAALKRDIATKSGSALFDFILADIQELKRILFDPHSHQAFMGAMEATPWLNEQLQAWLGEIANMELYRHLGEAAVAARHSAPCGRAAPF